MINIAIAEDMPIVLEGVVLLLSRIPDFKVVAEYTNGRELLENIGNTKADIIITDIDMPVMDGITATRLLMTRYPDKKVIALSMYSDCDSYFSMLNSGARGFVLKQSSSTELEKAVRDVFNGGIYFSSEILQNIITDLAVTPTGSNNRGECAPELTRKEIEMLKYICEGLSNKQLAEKLLISVKTVESRKTKLIEKTAAKNSSGLIIWAVKNKVINF